MKQYIIEDTGRWGNRGRKAECGGGGKLMRCDRNYKERVAETPIQLLLTKLNDSYEGIQLIYILGCSCNLSPSSYPAKMPVK